MAATMEAKSIEDSVSNMLKTHEQWANSNEPSINLNYKTVVEDMFDAWATADIPASFRRLYEAVLRLQVEWEKFGLNRSENRPNPHEGYWRALAEVQREFSGYQEQSIPEIEPVWLLVQQGVPMMQIATAIYGQDGIGPFLINRKPRLDLVAQEAKTPGSVIPKDWVHPAVAEKMAEQRKKLENRLQRTRELAQEHGDAPETVEQLLAEGVGHKQIARMKGLSIQQVIDIEEKSRDDSKKSQAAAEGADLTQRIHEMLDAGIPAAEISKQLCCTAQKVGSVVRDRNSGRNGE